MYTSLYVDSSAHTNDSTPLTQIQTIFTTETGKPPPLLPLPPQKKRMGESQLIVFFFKPLDASLSSLNMEDGFVVVVAVVV